MACSKELRIPKEWKKLHHDIVNEAIDPELFNEDEIFEWLKATKLCHDRALVSKYTWAIRPYHFMRYEIPLLPNSPLCREVFKIWVHFTHTIFVTDDITEDFDQSEVQELCDAFEELDNKITKQFPRLPSLAEMKQILIEKNVSRNVIPHVLMNTDPLVSTAKSLLNHGNFPQDDVKDFWRRMTVSTSCYLSSLKVKYITSPSVTASDVFWIRSLNGDAVTWLHVVEIISGAIGKVTAHLPLLTQLIILCATFCLGVNDIYSFQREKAGEVKCLNYVKVLAETNDVLDEADVVENVVRSLNALIKVIYHKIEKAKQENPDSLELGKMLDGIGAATAGWYFFHHYSPRYKDTQWRLNLVDVPEKVLEEWRRWDGEVSEKEIKNALYDYNPNVKKVIDQIISGKICNLDKLLQL